MSIVAIPSNIPIRLPIQHLWLFQTFIYHLLDIIEMKTQKNQFESPAIWVYIMTYLNYVVLTIFGWFRDLLRFYGIEKTLGQCSHSSSIVRVIITTITLWKSKM